MTSRILLFSDHVEKDKGTDRKIERNKEQYKKTETGGSDSSLPCDFFSQQCIILMLRKGLPSDS